MPENDKLIIEAAPHWINTDFLETILRKHKNDVTIKVKGIDVKYAVPKGESYASVMYRVNATYHNKKQCDIKRSYIIKGLPNDEMAKQKLSEYGVHGKEMEIYQKILPEFKKLMKMINDHSDLYPTALSINRQHDVIIFDDLSAKGYIMADRSFGLDMQHTKMSLKILAKMHASSMKLSEIHKGIFDEYIGGGMFTRKTKAFYPFFNSNMDALINEVSQWENHEYYAEKLRKMKPTFVENAIRVFDHEHEDDLRVLIHGDLWVNNVMFKYDENKTPIDVVMLDFQFAAYASPMIDLIYFIQTSTNDDIRQNCFEELTQYYYYNLEDTLKKLKYSGKFPTLHQFQQQMLRKFFFAFIATCIILPVMINEDPKNADFEALMSCDDRSLQFKKTIMGNKKFHSLVKKLLPVFDRKGLFDALN